MEKLYYSIGEVARLLDVNTTLIRFWEKEFELTEIRRDSKGNRIFDENDIIRLKSIYHLLKEKRMTIEGARRYLSDHLAETEAKVRVIETLKNIKRELLNIKKEIRHDGN